MTENLSAKARHSGNLPAHEVVGRNMGNAINAARIANRGELGLWGPQTPKCPLARHVYDTPEVVNKPSPRTARGRMDAARRASLIRVFGKTEGIAFFLASKRKQRTAKGGGNR